MNVHLTQELEQVVQSRVKSGHYGSASEVARDALRLLADRDELMELRKQEIRKKIAQGLASLERGEGVDGDELFAQLEQEEGAFGCLRKRRTTLGGSGATLPQTA